jgi:ABC transport system ATP-binding/permease protein
VASAILDLRGLVKSYGARTLFDGVDLSVQEGEKVGIIGRNGSGKSTLFRILSGEEGMEAGTLALRRGTRVGFLAQEPDFDPERSILETVGEGRRELFQILAEYDRITGELQANPSGDAPGLEARLARQGALAQRIEELGGWDARHRVETVLTRLGVDGWERAVGTLSGGERRRVALARTLLGEPDLLLLDEPTNHLDAATVLWLEETIFDFRGTVILVTHDRYFLDRVVDRMVEVTPGGLETFEGGYTDYLEARMARDARVQVEEEKRRKLIEKELQWARRSPPARTGKQKARRARAREMAAELAARDRTREGQVQLEAAAAPRLGRTILELDGVTKRYGERTVLTGVTDRLLAGDRVGIVGPNGAGKSTLLRIIAGVETADAGRVILGENTRLAWFDQERVLDPELTVGRAVSPSDWVEVGERRMHLRAYLDRFLFPSHVHDQKVSALSGGERNRLLLARLFLEPFNLLLLDEPTNDLDLDTLQVLEELLLEFEGCLLVVSHDRYLLDKICTSLLVFDGAAGEVGAGSSAGGGAGSGPGSGVVKRHHGGWDSWLAHTEARRAEAEARRKEADRVEREARAEAARGEARAAREASGGAKLSWRERRELDALTETIEKLEAEQATLEAALADPGTYAGGDEGGTQETLRRYAGVRDELESALARWMELEERAGG